MLDRPGVAGIILGARNADHDEEEPSTVANHAARASPCRFDANDQAPPMQSRYPPTPRHPMHACAAPGSVPRLLASLSPPSFLEGEGRG